MITFVVPAIPIAQPRPRATMIAGHASVYEAGDSHPIHAFKATCKLAWANTKEPMIEGPVCLDLQFVMPRPQNKRWKTREMPRYPNTKSPDIDNLAKSVMDALNGLAWKDDKQIYNLVATKMVAAGGEQPHVEVNIVET